VCHHKKRKERVKGKREICVRSINIDKKGLKKRVTTKVYERERKRPLKRKRIGKN
jgi:hypothetical protein